MDEHHYRSDLRSHFLDQMSTKLPSNAEQQYKEHIVRASGKVTDFDAGYHSQRRQSQRCSGGDADRALFEFPAHHPGEAFRENCDSSYLRHLQNKAKSQSSSIPSNSFITHKYPSDEGNAFIYETDSNVGGGSDGSSKTAKSSKTVVSKKSSQDLRKIVKSQCKLHEVINDTLKQMCKTETESSVEQSRSKPPTPVTTPQKKSLVPCRHCNDKVGLQLSQRDVMTETAKHEGDTLSVSIDDMVNSKVINPMIRKLQRMYLNNLREEMSLMEDLERLPRKVNEVYKATLFKPMD